MKKSLLSTLLLAGALSASAASSIDEICTHYAATGSGYAELASTSYVYTYVQGVTGSLSLSNNGDGTVTLTGLGAFLVGGGCQTFAVEPVGTVDLAAGTITFAAPQKFSWGGYTNAFGNYKGDYQGATKQQAELYDVVATIAEDGTISIPEFSICYDAYGMWGEGYGYYPCYGTDNWTITMTPEAWDDLSALEGEYEVACSGYAEIGDYAEYTFLEATGTITVSQTGPNSITLDGWNNLIGLISGWNFGTEAVCTVDIATGTITLPVTELYGGYYAFGGYDGDYQGSTKVVDALYPVTTTIGEDGSFTLDNIAYCYYTGAGYGIYPFYGMNKISFTLTKIPVLDLSAVEGEYTATITGMAELGDLDEYQSFEYTYPVTISQSGAQTITFEGWNEMMFITGWNFGFVPTGYPDLEAATITLPTTVFNTYYKFGAYYGDYLGSTKMQSEILDVVGTIDSEGVITFENIAYLWNAMECWGYEGDYPYYGINQVTVVLEPVNDETDAIAPVAVDENAPVEYYTLQGVKVANPVAGQIYIIRQGNKATKQIIR